MTADDLQTFLALVGPTSVMLLGLWRLYHAGRTRLLGVIRTEIKKCYDKVDTTNEKLDAVIGQSEDRSNEVLDLRDRLSRLEGQRRRP